MTLSKPSCAQGVAVDMKNKIGANHATPGPPDKTMGIMGIDSKPASFLRTWIITKHFAHLGLVLLLAGPQAVAQTLSRDVTANNYNLSKLDAQQKVPLTHDKSGVTAGIFRNEAKDAVVRMGSNGPISPGAG